VLVTLMDGEGKSAAVHKDETSRGRGLGEGGLVLVVGVTLLRVTGQL
jgi:hypothetical protein